MATRTVVLADGGGGGVALEYDYDDATLYLRAVRLVNNTTQSAYVWVRSTVTGRTYSRTQGSGTASINIGTNAAQRLQLTVTPSGKLDGVEWQFMYPVP